MFMISASKKQFMWYKFQYFPCCDFLFSATAWSPLVGVSTRTLLVGERTSIRGVKKLHQFSPKVLCWNEYRKKINRLMQAHLEKLPLNWCVCVCCYFEQCGVEHRWIPQVSCYLYIGISCQVCSVQSIGAKWLCCVTRLVYNTLFSLDHLFIVASFLLHHGKRLRPMRRIYLEYRLQSGLRVTATTKCLTNKLHGVQKTRIILSVNFWTTAAQTD